MAYQLNGMANEVVIESVAKITFKVGTNTIVMTNNGITITCSNLSMDATLECKLNALIMKEEVMMKESKIDMLEIK